MTVTDFQCTRCGKLCDVIEDVEIDTEPYGDRMVERRTYAYYSICCGGVSIDPGDIVLAGADGVVVVPLDSADTILARAERKAAQEDDYVAAVKRGEFSNQWVSDLLADTGCILE